MKNLLNCKGRPFRAKIYGIPVSGRIQVENDIVFLCQNGMDGADAHDKLGSRYSWSVGKGDEMVLARNNVTDFHLFPTTPEEFETFKDWMVGDRIDNGDGTPCLQVIFRSGELVVCKHTDCEKATANYTIDELYNNGYRFVPPKDEADAPKEEAVRELTMDEIAEKFGLAVDRIRVKKD